MTSSKRQIRLLAALALIVAITLVGLLGIQIMNLFGTLLPKIVSDIILIIMWWGSFALMVYAIKEYYQVLRSKKKKNIEFQVICLLGMVVAISHVGQLGVAGRQYVTHLLLPEWISHAILFVIFWIAFYFVYAAINLYKKI